MPPEQSQLPDQPDEPGKPDQPVSPEECSTLEEPPAEPLNEETGPGAEDELKDLKRAIDVVDPAVVRKAPRFRSFIAVGVLSGLILGLIIGLIAFRDPHNRTYMTMVLMVDLALVTTVAALVWAIIVERRSGRR